MRTLWLVIENKGFNFDVNAFRTKICHSVEKKRSDVDRYRRRSPASIDVPLTLPKNQNNIYWEGTRRNHSRPPVVPLTPPQLPGFDECQKYDFDVLERLTEQQVEGLVTFDETKVFVECCKKLAKFYLAYQATL